VLSSAGDSELGGDDFDRALFALLRHRIRAAASPASAAAVAADPSGAARLLAAAEAAKIRLSSCPEAAVCLPAVPAVGFGDKGLVGLDTTVTAAELLTATAALRARLWPPLAAAADQCKLTFATSGVEFERRLLVASGGSNGNNSGGTGSSSSGISSSSAAAVVDKYAPKPRAATAAVLVGGATRMPVVRDYVRHITGLQPR